MKSRSVIFVIVVLLLAIVGILILTAPNSNNEIVCNYDNLDKNYVGKTADECSRVKFICVPGTEYFDDECGCGCVKSNGSGGDEEDLKKNYCTPAEKMGEVCPEIYAPVCGWNDPDKIQCIKYPCAQTYSNRCFACHEENVLYWTEGLCPA